MNGLTETNYVFDTCAATFFIKKDKRMLAMREALDSGKWYASVITRMELRAEPSMSEEKLADVEAFIGAATVILLDDAVEKLTVAIRRDFRPKILLPDCIVARLKVAASAILLGATLLTDDTSLKKLVWPGYTVHPI
jgi:predicted nucleic acid-binding protein